MLTRQLRHWIPNRLSTKSKCIIQCFFVDGETTELKIKKSHVILWLLLIFNPELIEMLPSHGNRKVLQQETTRRLNHWFTGDAFKSPSMRTSDQTFNRFTVFLVCWKAEQFFFSFLDSKSVKCHTHAQKENWWQKKKKEENNWAKQHLGFKCPS